MTYFAVLFMILFVILASYFIFTFRDQSHEEEKKTGKHSDHVFEWIDIENKRDQNVKNMKK